jgi:hypothetical protein
VLIEPGGVVVAAQATCLAGGIYLLLFLIIMMHSGAEGVCSSNQGGCDTIFLLFLVIVMQLKVTGGERDMLVVTPGPHSESEICVLIIFFQF